MSTLSSPPPPSWPWPSWAPCYPPWSAWWRCLMCVTGRSGTHWPSPVQKTWCHHYLQMGQQRVTPLASRCCYDQDQDRRRKANEKDIYLKNILFSKELFFDFFHFLWHLIMMMSFKWSKVKVQSMTSSADRRQQPSCKRGLSSEVADETPSV